MRDDEVCLKRVDAEGAQVGSQVEDDLVLGREKPAEGLAYALKRLAPDTRASL